MADTPPTQEERHGAEVVAHHLPSGYSASFDGQNESVSAQATSSAPNLTSVNEESSLKLQGGDIHRELFKYNQRANPVKRSQTFSYARTTQHDDNDDEQFTAAEQRLPGGFRREFIQRRAPSFAARMPVTRNFVEFLDLYGSFAGEDLADSDDEAVDDTDGEVEESEQTPERRPLLGPRKSTRRDRKTGTASTSKTFFTLLKAFVGTGIMFLPKAFNNGGILFSSLCLVSISLVSMLAFHLLLQCREKTQQGGYGEIGQAIGGKKMRAIVLASISLSQLGFVCAGLVFVAQNLYSFGQAVGNRSDGESPISTNAIIGLQLLVIIPLAFIRNISKLGPAALFADVFILIGLTYIYYYDIRTLAHDGIHPTVVNFNPEAFTQTIGSCIFTFEGIGLILPIQSSMKKPRQFEPLLAVVMLIITAIFCSVGVLCYATFGTDTKIEVINNYPQTSPLVNAVQFMYSLAVLVGNPVQLFPAIRILENKIFKRSTPGSKSTATKWKKNAFRTFLACLCGGISILGANDLDRFVALIGSFACVPLVYIYPPLLHYMGVAESRRWKLLDLALILLGVVGMIYTTVVTIKNSFM